MSQAELFAAADLAQPAPKTAPWPAPVPENIRRHLERMLADARWAHEMPWRDWELASRTENFNAMADRLNTLGLSVDIEAVRQAFPKATLGRRHLAEWLRISKQVASEREAFAKYLGNDGPATVPKLRLAWEEAIALTRDAGGVAGLAHPPYNLRECTLQRLIEGGLGSIEVAGPGINPRCGKRWRAWAEAMGIVPIAGSDFHAQDRPGRWVGAVSTSLADLARLEANAKRG